MEAGYVKDEPLIHLMLMQKVPEGVKGTKIDQIAYTAWKALSASFALTTILSSVHITLVGLTLLNGAALWVSAVALLTMLNIQYAEALIPYLPERFQRNARFIQALVNECAALVPLVCLYFFNPVSKHKEFDLPPILCTHGYLHTSSAWFYLKDCLESEGFKVYTLNLGSPLKSIEEYSQMVEAKVEEIKKLTGKNEINLIGHSMGGVVNTHYAMHHAKQQDVKVSKIATIGSPLKGTRVAIAGVGECTNQMRHGPTNQFINEKIHYKIGESTDINFLHIGSENDGVILPYDSAVPYHEDSKKHVKTKLIQGVGHTSMLYSPRVAKWIVEFMLRQEPNPV